MRLLIITQKLDINDPILGFFHRWVEEFSKHCEKITVIALGVGEYNLPESVKVLSLGKEISPSRCKYLWRLTKYLGQEHKNYDTVFVHMNQEYVLLAGWWWRLTGKKIWFWRNHPKGSWLTRVAVKFSDRLFCTSPYSFTAQFKKTELMPAGIDTEKFKPDNRLVKQLGLVLCLGRIAPIKKIEQLIEAAKILKDDYSNVVSNLGIEIVGDYLLADRDYFYQLKKGVVDYGLENLVTFSPARSNNDIASLYNESELYVNMTPSGSLDKTILEAMACGTLVLVSNRAFLNQIDGRLIFNEGQVASLAEKIIVVLSLDQETKNLISGELKDLVVNNHSLSFLTIKIFKD